MLFRSTVLSDNLLPTLPTGPSPKISSLYLPFVFVSAYGWNKWPELPGHEATNNRCVPGLVQFNFFTRDATFEVECYDPAGYPVDSSYTIGAVLFSGLL